MRTAVLLCASMLVAPMAAGTAAAAPAATGDRDWATCRAPDGPDTIDACTRVIARGDREPAARRATALNERGLAQRRRGNVDAAIRDYDESLRLNPKSPGVYNNRGFAHAAKKDYEAAIRDYDRSLQLRPNDHTTLLNRASAHRDKGDTARALADLDLLVKIAPKDAVALFRRARIHADAKDYERALRDLDAAIKIEPDAPSHRVRGEVRRSMGDYDNALRDLDEAIRLDPKSDVAYRARGFTHSRKGDLARALTDYSTAISLRPTDPIHLRNRAAVRERSGDANGALQDLAQALALDPNSAETRRRHDRLKAAALGPQAPSPPPVAQAATSGRRVALVIGNSAYRHTAALGNPRNDAGDVAAALRKLGFDVVDGTDLDKRGMEDRVRSFSRKLDGADLALFFYAGHGLQVGGRNYLVPVDAKVERASELNFDTLDLNAVIAQMEGEQRVSLVFLDACRDNPLSRSLARGTRGAAAGAGLANVQSAIGTMIAYATQPENVALDGDGQRNSPFTTALLRHLGTPGLEIGAMMRRVRADVVKATNSKQVPWDHSSLLGEVVLAR